MQKLRRTHHEMSKKIKEEVQKQLDANFLKVINYPPWISNIVPVPKKDGKVRMCVDYRNLNRASPKDDFPLPHIDVLVDNTAHSKVFSFMDGFSGYNQIKMAPEDMEKTKFITPWGTFCYKVMLFGLKMSGQHISMPWLLSFMIWLNHKWPFVRRGPFSPWITLRKDDSLDYQIPNLIFLWSDLFVKCSDHPFLIRLTMADSSKSLFINEV